MLKQDVNIALIRVLRWSPLRLRDTLKPSQSVSLLLDRVATPPGSPGNLCPTPFGSHSHLDHRDRRRGGRGGGGLGCRSRCSAFGILPGSAEGRTQSFFAADDPGRTSPPLRAYPADMPASRTLPDLPTCPPAELRPARPSTSETRIPGRPVCLHILGLSPGGRDGPGSHVPTTPPPIYRFNTLEVVQVKSVVQMLGTLSGPRRASACLPACPPAEPQPARPSTSGTRILGQPARPHILGLSPGGRDSPGSHGPVTYI